MLKIRLSRGGAKRRPYYSIVVADAHAPRDGRFIEKVGVYDPLLRKDDPKRVTLKGERIGEWLAKGAQPTDRVARFLAAEGLAKWSHGTNLKKGEPHAKAKQRAQERAERDAALAAAREAAAAEPEAIEAEAVEAETVEAKTVEAEPAAAEVAEPEAPPAPSVEAEAAPPETAEAAETEPEPEPELEPAATAESEPEAKAPAEG